MFIQVNLVKESHITQLDGNDFIFQFVCQTYRCECCLSIYTIPSLTRCSSSSSDSSPCRLINVRIPVIVARSSIDGNSLITGRRSLPLDSSPSLIGSTRCHDHSPTIRFVKDRQYSLGQEWFLLSGPTPGLAGLRS